MDILAITSSASMSTQDDTVMQWPIRAPHLKKLSYIDLETVPLIVL